MLFLNLDLRRYNGFSKNYFRIDHRTGRGNKIFKVSAAVGNLRAYFFLKKKEEILCTFFCLRGDQKKKRSYSLTKKKP